MTKGCGQCAEDEVFLKLSVMPFMDEMTPEAKAVGSVNTFKLVDGKDGQNRVIGTNLDIKAIHNSLRQILTGVASPFDGSSPDKFEEGKVAAFVIGGGGATRVRKTLPCSPARNYAD